MVSEGIDDRRKDCLILTADIHRSDGTRLDYHNYVSDLDGWDPFTTDTSDESRWVPPVWLWLLECCARTGGVGARQPTAPGHSDVLQALDMFWSEVLPEYADSLGIRPGDLLAALQTQEGNRHLLIAADGFAQAGSELGHDLGIRHRKNK
jgi:hypothetical protein